MSDAQRDILKMLADNVISVDEAERLLKALNEGEQRKEEPRFGRRGHFPHGMGGMFESLGSTFSEIGPMIKSTIEEAMTGIFGDDLGELDEEEFTDVELVEDAFVLDDGMRLIIASAWKWGGSEDLQIRGVPGNLCRIKNTGAHQVQVRRSPSYAVIQWSGGPLTVDVPETVVRLRTRLKGGNIWVMQLGCEINVKTLGGNLELRDLHKDFKAKTMGGNIRLVLANDWQGQGRAHSMGGDLALDVPTGVSLTTEVITMGGTVSTDDGMRRTSSKPGFPGKSHTRVQIGEQQTDAFINLKTMGGDITLRNVDDEKHE